MIGNNLADELENAGLKPFQVGWATRLLNQNAGSRVRLIAPAGTGIGTTVCVVLAYLVRQAKYRRVLLVAPPMLKPQWIARIAKIVGDGAVIEINRMALWEAQTSITSDTLPFEQFEGVFVVTPDSLKQEEVWSAVHSLSWDYVAIDGTMRSGEGEKLASDFALREQSRILLFTNVAGPKIPEFEDINTSIQALLSYSSAVSKPVTFFYSSEEQFVLKQLERLLASLKSAPQARSAHSLLQRLAVSSFYALEISLGRMRYHIDTGLNEVDDDLEDITGVIDTIWNDTAMATGYISALLKDIAELPVDSKVEALAHFLQSAQFATLSVCIISFFKSTKEYVRLALEARDLSDIQVLTLADLNTGDYPPFNVVIIYDGHSVPLYNAVAARANLTNTALPTIYAMAAEEGD